MASKLTQILSDTHEILEIAKELEITCFAEVTMYSTGTLKVEYRVWNADKKKARELMKKLGITQMDKRYQSGDVDWKKGNLIINEVEECKVVGYDEEVIPEHVSKTPIYKCPNGKKTVGVED